MKTVVATGVFDLVHPGHVLFLEEARKLGDRLVVIVARDDTVEGRKSPPCVPEAQRLAVVRALKPVDEAVLGDLVDMYLPIREIDPDIVALGSDQHFSVEDLQRDLDREGLKAKVVRIPAYLEGELYSTRDIITKIKKIRECDG